MENLGKLLCDMHIGEKRRDAAPGVRGFMFQDLKTVEELINGNTSYICSEYIEDVFSETKEGLRIIQCKYYPNSIINIKQIIGDLYYQFLKLRILGYTGDIKSVLAYNGDKVIKPDINTVRQYWKIDEEKTIFAGDDKEKKEKLYACLRLDTKDSREQEVFNSFDNEDYLLEFIDGLIIEPIEEKISEYREKVGELLNGIIDIDKCDIYDREMRSSLLVSVAIKMVHELYNECDDICDNVKLFNSRKLYRDDFVTSINELIANELTFGEIIKTFADEAFSDLTDEQLTDGNQKRLDSLYKSSIQWLDTHENQYELALLLLNTVSVRKVPDGSSSDRDIREALYSCRDKIIHFYLLIWKIKLDIRQDRFEECIDEKIKEYIAFSFYEQSDWSQLSIVMGSTSSGSSVRDIEKIQSRLRHYNNKPQKWYLKNNGINGFGDYNLNVAQIIPEKLDVSMPIDDKYYIECMECIRYDSGCWNNIEDCKGTIFSKDCAKETSNE